MDKSFVFLTVVVAVLVLTGTGYSQDTAADSVTYGTGSDVVDLTSDAVIIKAEPERPRVNIISDRIKPEFDNINLEKSFMPELLGRSERVEIVDKQETGSETIDIDKTLSRSR